MLQYFTQAIFDFINGCRIENVRRANSGAHALGYEGQMWRSLCDKWHAHCRAANGVPNFLNANGLQVNLNNPPVSPANIDRFNLLWRCSVNAAAVVERRRDMAPAAQADLPPNQRLAVDHAVPLAVTYHHLVGLELPPSLEYVVRFIAWHHKLVLVTQPENVAVGYEMANFIPFNEEAILQRYAAVGVELQTPAF